MTSYTDKEIAAVAWAANAELQALHGDPAPSLPGDTEDAEAHAVTVAGIRAILDGATPEQLHETWMRSREAQGWTCGPRKDSRLKTHPALVPYAELPEHQRVKDRVFTAIVQAMTGQDYGEHVARHVTATPGQALYGRFQDAMSKQGLDDIAPWDELLDEQRAWEAIAQPQDAVTDMLGVAVQALRRITEGSAGCDPQTVAGSALGIIDRGIPGELRWDLIPVPEPELQPAPGIPLRSDAETAAMLRADLADAEAQLARWPKCPAGCNCRIGIDDDPDRNECGCDGPCNGDEQPAPDADVALASIAADRNQLRMALSRIAMGTAGDLSVAADKALAASSENARRTPALGALEPQPAPELAAAMAAFARVLSWFEQFGTRRTAIATRAQLAHAYQDGGLTVPEELRRFL